MALRDAKTGRFIKGSGGNAVSVEFVLHLGDLSDAVDKAAYDNFRHAGASIAKDAKASIVKADGASPEGAPPHTHKRVFLRRSLRWDATEEDVVIGPSAMIVGEAGMAHEFGGDYRGGKFPKRPFMGPALDRNISRLAPGWRGTVGG